MGLFTKKSSIKKFEYNLKWWNYEYFFFVRHVEVLEKDVALLSVAAVTNFLIKIK